MHWYVIHTKPRQEQRALLNLEQQGYECFLPMLAAEKLHQGRLVLIEEPLFPRYLFIRLDGSENGRSWGPIRSTRGVNRMVSFGNEPAHIDDVIVARIRVMSCAAHTEPQRLFTPGERLQITEGPFAGVDAVYQMNDGERRALVLIELLSKPVRMSVEPSQLRKVR